MTTHARRGQRPAPRRSSSYGVYAAFAAAALAIVGGVILAGMIARGGGSANNSAVVVPSARPASVQQSGYTYGDPNAPVTIDEYVDFQCPFCRMAVENVLPGIEQQYVQSGVAKIVAHPIAILGSESVQAAAAAAAANQQGKFWAYYDMLYANQGAENSGAFSDARLTQFAQTLGLDMTSFNQAFSSGTYVNAVQQTTAGAAAQGIQSTPTFLVNGMPVQATSGALSAAIQAASGS